MRRFYAPAPAPRRHGRDASMGHNQGPIDAKALPMKTLMLASLLLLAGCASMGGAGAPPVDVKGADVSSRTMGNGDVIEEYRVSGQLRMVKVTPSRGAPFYMYDKNGDGRMDNDKDGVSPVYWKLYSW